MLQRTLGIDPDDDPEAFLYAIPERINGTYLVASEPHEDEGCAYAPAPDLGVTPVL
jgi:hypothetical protein